MRGSIVRILSLAAVPALALGCGEFARLNPYDPSAPFEITIVGPTVAHVGDTITFTAETTPEWTRPEAPEWSSLDTRILNPLGGGRYAAAAGGSTSIRVRFGPRSQTVSVTVHSFAPTITAISPQQARADTGTMSVAVTGTNFYPQTVVTWDGTARPTRYIDPTRVIVDLQAADVATVGAHAVVAVNGPPGGGSSQPMSFQSVPPAPRIVSLDPGHAIAGGAAFTLEVGGAYLTPQTIVRWNGEARPTTVLDQSRARVAISGADIATSGTALLTMERMGETSLPMPFPVLAGPPAISSRMMLDLSARALVHDSSRSRLYASVRASGSSHAGSIAIIDPLAGAVTGSISLNADPGVMSLSHDGRYLYVALLNFPNVVRIDLATGSQDLLISLGSETGCGSYYAEDVATLPGHPRTIVVSRRSTCSWSLAVFDGAVMRQRATSSPAPYGDRIAASDRADLVYAHGGYPRQLWLLTVDAGGIERAPTPTPLMQTDQSIDIEYDAGYLFSGRGHVVDAMHLAPVVHIPAHVLTADVRRGRAHVFDWTTLRTSHAITGALIGSVEVPEAISALSMVRWGSDGLALLRSDRIVLVRSTLVGP